MKLVHRVSLAFKAMSQLGARRWGPYLGYQAGLRSGYLRRATQAQCEQAVRLLPSAQSISLQPILNRLPERAALAEIMAGEMDSLLCEADEIAAGQVRLFGGEPVALDLKPPEPLRPWTDYQAADFPVDIKLIWEPGRFGWAYTLGRAYLSSGDERYPQAFWRHFETFERANPPCLGPHWMSAQEAALRLMALAFAGQVFAASAHSSPERASRLARSVAAHAARIPPTLAYARAQNNNHLLSEAAGLFTAGLALPAHAWAGRWRSLGGQLFQQGLAAQIGEDGAFTQHSTSYQRLLLHLALWMRALANVSGEAFTSENTVRLARATRWLLGLVDRPSGRVPNLGPQDGANILPLAACAQADYRPVVQAAAQAFLGERPFGAGAWNELAAWLGVEAEPEPLALEPTSGPQVVMRPQPSPAWAYLRVAHFHARPGHADQLHLDLWWRGLNLAQDPGTYLYNAPPPWDNALAGSGAHNTLTLNRLDQMQRAGRFLWVDWAQARIVERQKDPQGARERVIAVHDGYRRLGVVHQRSLTAPRRGPWLVEDEVLPLSQENPAMPVLEARMHWLLPDWPWELQGQGLGGWRLRLLSPYGWICLRLSLKGEHIPSLQLVRAGEVLHGNGPAEIQQGWASPTYAQKLPALSVSLAVQSAPPIRFLSEWELPE